MKNNLQNILHSLQMVKTIDIFDMNYVFSSEIFRRLLQSSTNVLPKKSFLLHIGGFFKSWIQQVNFSDWRKEKSIPQGAILFFSQSKNQFDVLQPIVQITPNAINFGKVADYPFSLTTFKAHFISLFFLPIVLWRYSVSRGQLRLSFQYIVNRYWLTYGYYIALKSWIHKVSPKIVVLACDHAMESRVLRKVASEEKVRTIYVQHASVTNEFPALEFDFAFLQGFDALNAYSQAGKTKTIVYLIGDPKIDKYRPIINKNKRVLTIGICTNSLDPFVRVKTLIESLQKTFPSTKFLFRPHPSDLRLNAWTKLARDLGIAFSNPKIEEAYIYLSKVDCNIAASSNIHLESVLLNVYPLFYDFPQNTNLIPYSFLSSGLCEYFNDIDSLVAKIKELMDSKLDVRDRAIFYEDVINTPFDFKSSFLANKLIDCLEGKSIDRKIKWHKIEGYDLLAYSLQKRES